MTQLAVDKVEAEQKLADLEARYATATSGGGPAAELVQAAQVMAGLVAARKRELALVTIYLEDTRAICTDLESQHANQEDGTVAVCGNCLADISTAQLLACRPGPRSDALLHCPTCAVNPNLH